MQLTPGDLVRYGGSIRHPKSDYGDDAIYLEFQPDAYGGRYMVLASNGHCYYFREKDVRKVTRWTIRY